MAGCTTRRRPSLARNDLVVAPGGDVVHARFLVVRTGRSARAPNATRVEEGPQPVDATIDEAIARDVRAGRTTDAIQRYRKTTNASLLDAKAHVESLARTEGAILPSSGPRFAIVFIVAIFAIVLALRFFYGTSGVTHVPH